MARTVLHALTRALAWRAVAGLTPGQAAAVLLLVVVLAALLGA